MPQDGAIAYHAQALTRALLKRQAIDNGHARLVRQVQVNQTYIKQGPTEAEKEIRRQNAIARKNAENLRAIMQSQPEATGIASGVIVGMAMSSYIAGPEMLAFRIANATRWMGAVRMASTVERIGAGLSYRVGSRSGVLTLQGIGRTTGTFAARAASDIGIQYGGGLLAHKWNFGEAYDEINLTSASMAGLPGEGFFYSLRNNIIGAGLEFKLNREELFVFKPMPLTQPGLLNFGQKVVIGVGADLISSNISGRFQQRRLNIESEMYAPRHFLIRPFVRLRGLFYLSLESSLESASTNTISVSGSALSNVIEQKIDESQVKQDNIIINP